MDRPSVVSLSLMSVHPTHTVELFGNILRHLIDYGLGQFVLKLYKKNIQMVLGDRASQIEGGMKNWRFSTNISK